MQDFLQIYSNFFSTTQPKITKILAAIAIYALIVCIASDLSIQLDSDMMTEKRN